MDAILSGVAKKLVSGNKGILAADESLPTIQKRFEAVKLENSEENRRSYRELLFSTPNIEEFISGVIMFEESLPLAKILEEKGIIPGVKVDKGKIDLPNFPGETYTQGLDDLKIRLEDYKSKGAKFTKWRAVIGMGAGIPTQEAIEVNVLEQCIFALLSQQAGLVPIVEPEVLMEGNHDIIKCEDITRAVLTLLFAKLQEYKVDLEGLLLKPNMVLPGKDSEVKSTPEEIGEVTVSTLKRTVPKEVPGIVFLSGGQSAEEASMNLNAINLKKGDAPWELSYSFGRALQDSVLKTWIGRPENKESAQKVFYHRAKMNFLARQGKYTPDAEKTV